MIPLRFTFQDLERANREWRCNCGPGALAAILGLSLHEVRPHMGDFERKGYTNPTLMYAALKSAWPGRYATKQLKCAGKVGWDWPRYGLARVQWEGPWTEPGVPMRARYRYTHWIGVKAASNEDIGIFDINTGVDDGNGQRGLGWCSLKNWGDHVVPFILKHAHPRANGKWHLTHAIEVEEPGVPEYGP